MNLLVLIFFGISTVCMAEPSVFKKTQGLSCDLCDEFLENLNLLAGEEPINCNLRFHSKFKDFRLPKWEELKIEEHMDAIESFFFYVPYNFPYRENFLEEIKADFPDFVHDIKSTGGSLMRSRIDLNFNGKSDTIYWLRLGACKQRSSHWLYFRVDEQGEFKPFRNQGHGSIFTPGTSWLFYYRGRIYEANFFDNSLELRDTRTISGVTGPNKLGAVPQHIDDSCVLSRSLCRFEKLQ